MQTHPDYDAERITPFLDRLKIRADDAMAKGNSQITTGEPGEKPIDEWKHGKIHVTKMPEDEQGILRMSVGGGTEGLVRKLDINYCVFRGDRTQCAYMLEQAAKALREGHQL